MRYIKWLLFNGIFVFVLYDATIGLTKYQEQSYNLIPFLVSVLFFISIVVFIVLVVGYALYEEMERDKLIELRAKLTKRSKGWRVFDASFDFIIAIWLSSFGFFFTAIFYFLHMVILQVALKIRNDLIDELEKI
jgi:hypothetical protein